MKRTPFALAMAAILVLALLAGSCSDDDDVSTDEGSTSTSTTESVDDASTTEAPAPTYEFAVQLDVAFSPVGMPATDVGEEIVTHLYPGQTARFEYIELDPEGPACPTDATIEVTDESGAVIASGTGSEVEIPETAPAGPVTVTVRCERDGEPGEGDLGPTFIASLLDVTVSPTSIPAGGSVTVTLDGGCPAGFEGIAAITPEEGGFAVFGDAVPLGDDGTAELTTPDALPPGTLYATVNCIQGDQLALGFEPFEVTTG